MCRWLFPVRLFRYARANMAACIMRHRDAGKDIDAGSTVLAGPLRAAVRSAERAEEERAGEERAGEPVSNSVRPDRWDFDVLISGSCGIRLRSAPVRQTSAHRS